MKESTSPPKKAGMKEEETFLPSALQKLGKKISKISLYEA